MSRGDLTEVEWRILRVLLPIERDVGKRGRGRPPEDNRNVINGILWRLRTGAPWRDIPEKYGNWNSIFRRFRRWSASGVWESAAVALAETMAESGHYNIDSTSVRAHVSAAGRKRGIHRRALGRSRGGFTSKIHCLGDARGRPIAFNLTPGEAADCKTYDTLIELPEQAPDALLADKAYDTDAIRDDLKKRGIKAVIPPKSNRTATIRYSKRLYRERNCIERVIGHLKINRAIATRYDQLADSFLGMLYIATARYWIKFVHAA
ncbi:MAG: IS5 family transposase [Pseudolabrys sp.]